MLILLAAAALTAAPDPTAATPARCRPTAAQASGRGPVRARPLGEMPPAQQLKAVWRFDENGCPSPIVVRSEVGIDGR